jgi:proline dehydrogenase
VVKSAVLRLVAGRYVAGPELADALRVVSHLDAAALGYWDGGNEPAEQVAAAYREAAAALPANAYLSVKAPSVGYDAALLAGLGVPLHLDALGPETQERVLALGEQLGAGVTLPARWRRSLADAQRAIDAGLPVRIVKGQWEDPDGDASSYLELVDALAGRVPRLEIATHNTDVARAALERAPGAELALLYGLPVPRVDVAVTRVYVPYGYAWLPYALSQARKNPRIVWWLVRDAVSSATGRRASSRRA